MTDANSLTLAQQEYIETITALIRENGQARTTDLARRLGVSLPSVTEAVSRLARLGIASRPSRHEIVLTPGGREVSDQLDRRHQALRRFMVDVLAMDEPSADETACRIEHCIDPAFTARLTRFADFLAQEQPPAMRSKWLRAVRAGARSRDHSR